MDIEVRLHGSLENARPGLRAGEPLRLDVPVGATVGEAAQTLGLTQDAIHLIFVNGALARMERVLEADDRVALFPAIGGGH